jgi:hypothetical protein
MSVPSDIQTSKAEAHGDAHLWADHGSDFVLIAEGKPPSRIELARERMLICRLYLDLLRTITDDYGTAFAAQNDSLTIRTIGIYVFLRTAMCSPARPSQIAQALKLPRGAVLRRLQELVKDGYVERVGNASASLLSGLFCLLVAQGGRAKADDQFPLIRVKQT